VITLALFALAIIASSCGRAPRQQGVAGDQAAVAKIAVLPFENLTGDAALDWVRNAGPAMLGDELAGSAHVTAVGVGSLADARVAGIPQVLHTYFTRERSGNLRVHFEMEDAASLRVEPAAFTTGTLLGAVDDLAHRLDPQARGFSTSNPLAMEAWGQGAFEHAVELDPDFGAAWLSWVRTLAQSGKTDDALQTADRALARKTLRTDWSRSELRVLIANIRKDIPGRAAALSDLAHLAPSDAAALTAAAQAQGVARNFQASADLYRKVLAADPSNAAAMNALGYAEGFLGDVETARRIFEDYGRQPGSRVNSHDSLGEVYFMNGRFREAEKEFSQAIALDPNFLQGAPMVKAAYAHWLAGDLAGADAMFQKYAAAVAKRNVPLAVWRESTWLYATGRQDRAEAMLAKAQPDERIRLQLAIWKNAARLPSGLENLRALYIATPPARDGIERILYGSALVEAGKEAEARTILKRWPLPENSSQPEIDTIVFPKYLELRKKLEMN
jgi:tetratricopeptide (TPR) repeat protein